MKWHSDNQFSFFCSAKMICFWCCLTAKCVPAVRVKGLLYDSSQTLKYIHCNLSTTGLIFTARNVTSNEACYVQAAPGSACAHYSVSLARPDNAHPAPKKKTAGDIYKGARPSVVLIEAYGDDGKISKVGSAGLRDRYLQQARQPMGRVCMDSRITGSL